MDLNDMELLKLKEQLTPEQNRNIERLVDEKKKKVWVAYLLLFVFGGFGAYKFYIGENTGGAIMLILTIIGFFTSVFFIGTLINISILVVLFVDLFRIPVRVKEYNKKLEEIYIKQYLHLNKEV
jgi:TM2 domain-containing membrane protein YozV